MRNLGVKAAKHTGIYSAATIIGRCISLVTLPIYTRFLTPKDYGILEMLDLAATVGSFLLSVRLSISVFYFYHTAGDPRSGNAHVSTAIFGSYLAGLLAAAIGLLGAHPICNLLLGTDQYVSLIRILAVALAFLFPFEAAMASFRLFERPTAYAAAVLCRLGGSAVLNVILLVGYRMGVASMVWSNLVMTSCVSVVVTGMVLRRTGLHFRVRYLRQQIAYTAPLAFSSMGEMILNFGDRYFLRVYASLPELGLYALAYKFGMLVATIHEPFNLFWQSQILPIMQDRNSTRIVRKSCTYLTLVLGFVALALALLAKPVLRVMVGPQFRSAAVWIPWLALAYLLRAVAAHLRHVFLAAKKTAYEAAATWGGTIAVLAFYALLIPVWKVWGAVMATLIGFAVLFVLSLWLVWHAGRILPEGARTLHIAACGAAICIAHAWIPAGSFVAQAASGVLLLAAFPLLLWITGFVSSDERRYLSAARDALLRRAGRAAAAEY